MASATGILFEDLEPPNPYLKKSWISLPVGVERPGFPSYLPPSPTPQRQALLPSSSTSVVVHVIQDIARTTITQIFNNDSPVNIQEGKYQFPVPYGSSVVDFRCRIGDDRVIEGQVKPREIAQAEFEHAREYGRTAGLVEQDTPEIFTTKIGNIPANTTIEAELSLIFFLKYNLPQSSSTITLTIPTYIAPRYGQPDCEVNQHAPAPGKLYIAVEILNADEISRIDCDTHKVVVEKGAKQQIFQHWADFVAGSPAVQKSSTASVKLLRGYTCLDRDFVLRISTIASAKPRASLETHPSIEGHSAIMIEIPPDFMLESQEPVDDKEIIFLVDRSGSMAGKIHGLISSMQFYLRSLPMSTLFNICSFGSSYQLLWEQSRAYSEITLNEALYYVSSFSSNLGGTDLLPALEHVVLQQNHSSKDIIVLTDGEVWRLEETIRFVRLTHIVSKKAIRFFALGIGNAVSHELVEGIANSGGGYAEIIPATSSGNWEDRLVAVLRAALSGHVTSLSIDIEGLDTQYERNNTPISRPTFQMSPGNTLTLSPFGRSRIFILAESGQLNPNSVINIKTTRNGRAFSTVVPITVLQIRDSLLHKFAARALLHDLEREDSWIQQDSRIRDSLSRAVWTKKEGERLGSQWSLVSKWTSFVAVEANSDQALLGMIVVPHYKQLDGDKFGLLRPRGGPTVKAHPTEPLQAAISKSYISPNSSSPAIKEKKSKRISRRYRFPDEDISLEAAPRSLRSEPDSMLGNAAEKSSRSRKTDDSVRRHQDEAVPHHYLRATLVVPIKQSSPEFHKLEPRIPQLELQELPMMVPCCDQNYEDQDYEDQEQNTIDMDSTPNPPAHPLPTTNSAMFVRRIVSFQRADGRFDFHNLDTVERNIGSEVFVIIEALMAAEYALDVAVTIVIVALLEERFHANRGLWLLIVQKAREYIGIPENVEHPGMLVAKNSVNNIQEIPLEEETEGEKRCDD
ncbi:putative NAD(+) ADP-ribosyltransferase [Microsporum canis]